MLPLSQEKQVVEWVRDVWRVLPPNEIKCAMYGPFEEFFLLKT